MAVAAPHLQEVWVLTTVAPRCGNADPARVREPQVVQREHHVALEVSVGSDAQHRLHELVAAGPGTP